MSHPAATPHATGGAPPTVFFDGACPMCRREIAHYRRIGGAGRLAWVDIAADDSPLPIDGLDHDRAMARFHVRDASGRWQTGAWGFAEMWSHLDGYRHVARALRACRLVPLLDRIYSRFAGWRLTRRCQDTGQCRLPEPAPAEDRSQ